MGVGHIGRAARAGRKIWDADSASVGRVGVLGIADDADDLVGAAVLRQVEAEARADGIFTRLEELLTKVSSTTATGRVEAVSCSVMAAAADNLLAQGFQVARSDVIPRGAGCVVTFGMP